MRGGFKRGGRGNALGGNDVPRENDLTSCKINRYKIGVEAANIFVIIEMCALEKM